MDNQKTAIVIGSGAGGAAMARELQGEYQVTILEAGREFKPFSYSVNGLSELRRTGMFLDERMIRLLLPSMVVDKTSDMVLVRGEAVGGTTTLATGNAVRYDGALKELGIDLDPEFEALAQTLPISTEHSKHWNKATQELFALFEEMGLEPVVTPKLVDAERCVNCGHCAIGCPAGAKWDTRRLIEEAVSAGAELVTGCRVESLTIEQDRVTGVNARIKGRRKVFSADLVVLAAGGLGSPVILENSGIPCEKTLFVDPVLCVAGIRPDFGQDKQLLMPFISQQDGYILSPYMDYLSFFFHKKWRRPMKDIVSIMIKFADEEKGSSDQSGINKTMTEADIKRLKRAVGQSRDILERFGIPRQEQFIGIVNAGHPGGMLPLTAAEKDTLHNERLPQNLYVADATILPKAMGNPPILTIMALSKKIASLIKANQQ